MKRMESRSHLGRFLLKAVHLTIFPILLLGGCDRTAPVPTAAPLSASVPASATAPVSAPASAPASVAASSSAPAAGPTIAEAAGIRYIEIVTARADPTSELPLVMAIHGLGDQPENFAPVLADLDEPARLIVPRGLSAYHGGYSWFPFRGELREEAVERGVVAAAQALARALDALQKTRPTRGRPIVTGFSQGGALSFALAVLHPTSVAASIPVGGWVAFPLPKEAAPRPPITALHGAADSLIPVGPTRAAVTSLRALGFQAELREFPGVGHSIPEPMRRELLGLVGAAVREQARKPPPAPAP
jgi:phospholipase/carboxylesterase